ncbi:MAG: penicillin acylase family protein, partial [Longimicrobiales bacterium]
MLLNPVGGYIQQENDSFHFTNMNEPMDPASFPPNFPEPRLRLRSQHAIELLDNDRKLSLEDVVRLKHSMRMLLADRVKPELIAAVRRTDPAGDVAAAIDLLADWDNTAAADSRGGMLFHVWWERYTESMGESEPYREPWSTERPVETPRGIADAGVATEAFAWAVEETRRRFGAWDVAWGDVHRVRRGDVDVPVGGCGGALGCFRVLNFDEAPDGKLIAAGGDGWVLAVEFTSPPHAYSVLAYGESANENSPYHADQAAMFADNRLKEVAFTEDQIRDQLVVRYRPGEEAVTDGAR